MLQLIVNYLTYSLFKLDPNVRWCEALNFFLYDSIKILLLLFFMITLIGFLRSFLSSGKVRGWLAGKKVFANVFAAMFGAVTPFCSCSSIPLFISFIEAGVPLGVTFSFLLTSPIINEYLVVLMIGFFGIKITLLYVLSGLFIGVICGLILGNMKLEKYLVKDILTQDTGIEEEEWTKGFKARLLFGLNEAVSIIKKLWAWILVGVGLGAVIHNFVPQSLVEVITSKAGLFGVPLATILGVPMYGSCAAIVPIAVALFQKGFPLGTTLSFMMAISALSLPEAIMLRRVMTLKLIAIFFGLTAFAIIFTGYLFNFLQKVLI